MVKRRKNRPRPEPPLPTLASTREARRHPKEWHSNPGKWERYVRDWQPSPETAAALADMKRRREEQEQRA